jgi:hypothetical protein
MRRNPAGFFSLSLSLYLETVEPPLVVLASASCSAAAAAVPPSTCWILQHTWDTCVKTTLGKKQEPYMNQRKTKRIAYKEPLGFRVRGY